MAKTIENRKFGTQIHGKPYYSSNGVWRRNDAYTSKATGETFHESYFAAGPDDDSRIHPMELYDSRCSCCYLNFGHTHASHEQHLGANL